MMKRVEQRATGKSQRGNNFVPLDKVADKIVTTLHDILLRQEYLLHNNAFFMIYTQQIQTTADITQTQRD